MYFLESKRIGLRQLKEADIDGGYKDWLNDSVVCRYNSHHKYPVEEDGLREYVKALQGDTSLIVMAVVDKVSKRHIGNISLQEIDLLNREAEIAFLFGEKEYWNKGYATEAAKMMINHAFNELGLNRIYFGTADSNIGMQRVGEKLKFCKSGVRREALFKNGIYHDIYDYDLLRKEWNADNR